MQTIDDSPEYFRMREAQEREAAANAVEEGIRQIHTELAGKYRDLAKDAEKRAHT